MSKRTVSQKEEQDNTAKTRVTKIKDDIELSDSEDDDSDDSDNENKGNGEEDIINVDFDFFDLNPEVDFLGLKTFLKQLFGDDFSKFDLSGLANIILDPKHTSIGSSIKTDGKEGDPLALLALVSLKNYKLQKPLNTLVEYLLKKSQSQPELYILLSKVLNMNSGEKVGLVFNERIINVPVEVTPPLFKFLVEEVNKQEPDLKYFIIISKVYKLVESQISDDSDSDSDGEPARAKKVKKNKKNQEEFDYFHYEDMILEKASLKHGHFKYDIKLQETDARRVFTDYGIDPQLSIILVERKALEDCVPQLEAAFPPF